MKVLSLFSGIGSFEEGLDLLNVNYDLINYCENNKDASKAYSLMRNEPEEKNLGNIFKVNEKEIKDFDLMTYGFPCFKAGHLVHTLTGWKPIEEIKKGDYVLTHKNRFRKVLVPMKKETDTFVDIKVAGLPLIETTTEHPFYVLEDKKSTTPQWIEAMNLTTDMYVGIALDYDKIIPTHTDTTINRDLADEDFWFYFGIYYYYLVQNDLQSFNENKVKITKNTITNRTFGSISKKTLRYYENNQDLILKDVMHLPKNMLQKFLIGFLLKVPVVSDFPSYTSDNKELLLSLSYMFAKAFHKLMPIEELSGDKYRIKIKPLTTKFVVDQPKYLFVKIMNIMAYQDDTEFVYNMEVEQDNSYVVQNVIVHNCQTFSIQGKREGFKNAEKGLLFFESMRIVKEKKPKVMIAENVAGLLSHDKGNTFKIILQTLEELGYNNYYKLCNACYHDVPQSRERVFIISIRKDIDNGTFEFPEEVLTKKTIRDIIQLDKNGEITKDRKKIQDKLRPYLNSKYHQNFKTKTNTKKVFDGVEQNYFNSGYCSHRIYSIDGIAPTITTKNDIAFLELEGYLTSTERFLVQGFKKEDVELLKENGFSDNILNRLSGNTIPVGLSYAILKQVLKTGILN